MGPKTYCQSKLLLPKMSFGEAGEQNSEKSWLELALVKVTTNIVAVLIFFLKLILFIFLYSRFLLVIYFIHISVYMSILLLKKKLN